MAQKKLNKETLDLIDQWFRQWCYEHHEGIIYSSMAWKAALKVKIEQRDANLLMVATHDETGTGERCGSFSLDVSSYAVTEVRIATQELDAFVKHVLNWAESI